MKIPTAINFAKNYKTNKAEETTGEYISSMLINFAKLHVKAALETAVKKGKTKHLVFDAYTVDKDSILNAYPETNIK